MPSRALLDSASLALVMAVALVISSSSAVSPVAAAAAVGPPPQYYYKVITLRDNQNHTVMFELTNPHIALPGQPAGGQAAGFNKYGVSIEVCAGKIVSDYSMIQRGDTAVADAPAAAAGQGGKTACLPGDIDCQSEGLPSPTCVSMQWYLGDLVNQTDELQLCPTSNYFSNTDTASLAGRLPLPHTARELHQAGVNGSSPVPADWRTEYFKLSMIAQEDSIISVGVAKYHDTVSLDESPIQLQQQVLPDYLWGGYYESHECTQQNREHGFAMLFHPGALVTANGTGVCAPGLGTADSKCFFHLWVASVAAVADYSVNYQAACGVTQFFTPVLLNWDGAAIDKATNEQWLSSAQLASGDYQVAVTATLGQVALPYAAADQEQMSAHRLLRARSSADICTVHFEKEEKKDADPVAGMSKVTVVAIIIAVLIMMLALVFAVRKTRRAHMKSLIELDTGMIKAQVSGAGAGVGDVEVLEVGV
jgi:hypothetical protein